jgi:SAM-dependent methyltransferase
VSTPRFELQPTSRFGDRASDYALFRPSYPKEAIDAALAGLSADRPLVVADIGAGTGISSRLFADRGLNVYAIEPNQAMREGAEPHPRVTFVEGTAEATGLETASVDLVVCAQAFHWFRPEPALAEFGRIAKPGGRLVFLVNERDISHPATRGYSAAVQAAVDRELSEGMAEAIDDALRAASLQAARAWFPYAQALPRDGLIGRARSASYVPKEGPRYDRLIRDLEDLWAAHRDALGLITLGYRTQVRLVDLGPA